MKSLINRIVEPKQQIREEQKIFSTIVCRVVFSLVFGISMNMGVIGVAFAMCLDWGVRALLFWVRFKNGKWKKFRVIG